MRRALVLTVFLLLAPLHCRVNAQHVHINAGALAPTPGSALAFANADLFATNSGYILNLNVRLAGPAIGLYDGGPTFTALALLPDNGGPEPFHALAGTKVVLEVVSLDGPAGGSLTFWESPDCEISATRPTFTIQVGTTNGNFRFPLSQNGGEPGADPYGHCHGRRYTTAVPGLYVLGVRLYDSSTNGPGGGPQHQPSDITYFFFQAGVTLDSLTQGDDGITAHFATKIGGTYFLETTESLTEGATWDTVAGPLDGDGYLQSLIDPAPTGTSRFYRLRYETP